MERFRARLIATRGQINRAARKKFNITELFEVNELSWKDYQTWVATDLSKAVEAGVVTQEDLIEFQGVTMREFLLEITAAYPEKTARALRPPPKR